MRNECKNAKIFIRVTERTIDLSYILLKIQLFSDSLR